MLLFPFAVAVFMGVVISPTISVILQNVAPLPYFPISPKKKIFLLLNRNFCSKHLFLHKKLNWNLTSFWNYNFSGLQFLPQIIRSNSFRLDFNVFGNEEKAGSCGQRLCALSEKNCMYPLYYSRTDLNISRHTQLQSASIALLSA